MNIINAKRNVLPWKNNPRRYPTLGQEGRQRANLFLMLLGRGVDHNKLMEYFDPGFGDEVRHQLEDTLRAANELAEVIEAGKDEAVITSNYVRLIFKRKEHK